MLLRASSRRLCAAAAAAGQPCARAFATKKAGKKGVKKAEGPRETAEWGMSMEFLKVFKDSKDVPVPADADCPQWVWDLAKDAKTYDQLSRTPLDDMTMGEARRFIKLSRRRSIKEANSRSEN